MLTTVKESSSIETEGEAIQYRDYYGICAHISKNTEEEIDKV